MNPQPDLSATLSTDKSMAPNFTEKQTVKLPGQTAQRCKLILSYTVHTWTKSLFRMTWLVYDLKPFATYWRHIEEGATVKCLRVQLHLVLCYNKLYLLEILIEVITVQYLSIFCIFA